ncbi:MAG: hypothetical protein ACRD5L_03690, partial [Bryobacteraceae bacterium]
MATPVMASESSTQARAWPRMLLMVGRVALGLIFVFAAFTKLYFGGNWHLRDYQFFFSMAIDSYRMLPLSAVQL